MSGEVVLHSLFINFIFRTLLVNLPPSPRPGATNRGNSKRFPAVNLQRKGRFLQFPLMEVGKCAGIMQAVLQN